MADFIVSLVPLVFMGIWNLYLLRQNHQLVDRLMSRNFGEYATAKKFIENPAEDPQNEKKEEVKVSAYDEQRARELNGMVGIG